MEFNEYMIKRNKTAKEIFLSALLYIAAAILSVIGFTFLTMVKLGSIALLLVCGLFFGAFKLSSRMNKEFEYICTEDNIDIDVIMNATSRKRLISFSIKEVELIASVNDDTYKNRLNEQFEKVIDATTARKDANVYFAIVEKKGKTLVKFEPPHSILSNLYKFAPSKVRITQ